GELNAAAICMVVCSNIYRTFGNSQLALKTMWAAREQLSKSPDFQYFLMPCNVNMGGTYFDMKHYDEAIKAFNIAIEMAEPREAYYWLIYALQGIGKVYLEKKKYPEAKEYLEKA